MVFSISGMLIQCEKCQTRYNLDEAKIPGKGAKVTCPTCKNVFIVMKDSAPAPATAPGAAPATARPAAAQAPAQPKSLLDSFFDDGKTSTGGPSNAPPPVVTAGRGIRSWKVRVASGLVYDFTDPATLKAWIAEKKVTLADQISPDGGSWTAIGSIANLDSFFGVASGGPSAPVFGAPGVPPATGFGPAPTNAAAPAFAPASTPPGFSAPPPVPPPGPAGAGPSLADLFAMPAGNGAAPADPPRAADPFGAAPAANPFGSASAANPFGGASTAPANPFGPTSAANPFGASAAPDPFGAAGDPFAQNAAAPAPAGNPFGGADPFASQPAPAASAPADPFGGATANPFGAGSPSPFGTAATTPEAPAARPAPPPWSNVAAPAAPASAPPPPVSATRGKTPLGAIAPPAASAPSTRNLGRTIGLGAGVLGVVVLLAGIGLNFNRIKVVVFPNPVPTPRIPISPHVVATLDGEARASYLAGRRYLLADQPEAYGKAEAEFRKALAKAERNPRATAEVLEALALQKTAGGAVPDEALNRAAGEAVSAFKEDPHGVETNRALAQYYIATAHPEQAKNYVDTALTARPDDAESLYLRAMLTKTSDAAKSKDDLAAAVAKDPTLARAKRALLETLPADQKTKAAAELTALDEGNKKALEALAAGTYAFTPEESVKLLAEKPAAVVATGTPATSPTAVVAASAAPSAAPSAAATVAPTAVVVATTPVAKATPRIKESPVAVASPVTKLSPTPKPAPSPKPTAENSLVATAGAEDHYIAGNALAQAGSWDDAVGEYEEAAKSSPNSVKYQLALGTAYFNTKKFQDAAETLGHVLESDANNAPAHRLLGMIYESTGQTAQACAEFQDFVRLAPRSPQVADVQARIRRDGCGG